MPVPPPAGYTIKNVPQPKRKPTGTQEEGDGELVDRVLDAAPLEGESAIGGGTVRFFLITSSLDATANRERQLKQVLEAKKARELAAAATVTSKSSASDANRSGDGGQKKGGGGAKPEAHKSRTQAKASRRLPCSILKLKATLLYISVSCAILACRLIQIVKIMLK